MAKVPKSDNALLENVPERNRFAGVMICNKLCGVLHFSSFIIQLHQRLTLGVPFVMYLALFLSYEPNNNNE